MKAFAILTVIVLVVIGAAVGASSSSWSQPVYGPSWGRFTMAFPSTPAVRPIVYRSVTYGRYYESRSTESGVDTSVGVTVSGPSPAGGWSTAVVARILRSQFGGYPIRIHATHDGAYTSIAGPSWGSRGGCFGEKFTFDSHALWQVRVVMRVAPTGSIGGPSNCPARWNGVGELLGTFSPVG